MAKEKKEEIKKEIEEFFKNHQSKTSEQIKKIKVKAMSVNLKLGEKRKLFCKKCNKVYDRKEGIKITKDKKVVKCNNCREKSVWKMK